MTPIPPSFAHHPAGTCGVDAREHWRISCHACRTIFMFVAEHIRYGFTEPLTEGATYCVYCTSCDAEVDIPKQHVTELMKAVATSVKPAEAMRKPA